MLYLELSENGQLDTTELKGHDVDPRLADCLASRAHALDVNVGTGEVLSYHVVFHRTRAPDQPTDGEGNAQAGARDAGSIHNRAIAQNINSIEACYRKELEQNPRASGRLVIQYIVTEVGVADDVRIHRNQLSPVFGECVARAFQGLRFEGLVGDGQTLFEAPISVASAQSDSEKTGPCRAAKGLVRFYEVGSAEIEVELSAGEQFFLTLDNETPEALSAQLVGPLVGQPSSTDPILVVLAQKPLRFSTNELGMLPLWLSVDIERSGTYLLVISGTPTDAPVKVEVCADRAPAGTDAGLQYD